MALRLSSSRCRDLRRAARCEHFIRAMDSCHRFRNVGGARFLGAPRVRLSPVARLRSVSFQLLCSVGDTDREGGDTICVPTSITFADSIEFLREDFRVVLAQAAELLRQVPGALDDLDYIRDRIPWRHLIGLADAPLNSRCVATQQFLRDVCGAFVRRLGEVWRG